MMDFIYTFHFQENEKNEAIKRFNLSLDSIDMTECDVCVINCSDYCIQKDLKYPVKYLHEPKKYEDNLYNRSFMINQCVNKLVTSEYFNISDIDILYPKTFVTTIESIIKENTKPCRIVYFNNNMGIGDFNTYDECKSNYETHKDHIRSYRGRAGGLGIVHTKSFHKVNGFEERYIGYGPEDQDFNLRISQINKYIELDNENVNTYHIWHNNSTPKKKHRENLRIFNYISDYIKKNNLQLVKSGSIEIPQIIYHQNQKNIAEMEF